MPPTVLLINPPIYDFAAYDLFNKPLGLLYLAGFVRQAGYAVRLADALDRNHPLLAGLAGRPATKADGTGKYYREVIDRPAVLREVPRQYRRYGLPEERLAQAIEQAAQPARPLAVLVTSMMTYWYPAVAEAIALVRRLLPGVPVALGGVYATLMPEHARRVCRPDALFAGPALSAALGWLDSLAGSARDYGSLSDDFAAWPDPAYDLYDGLDYLTVLSSVGCPCHCDYCASRLIQPRLQQLSPDAFVRQLERLLPHLHPAERSPSATPRLESLDRCNVAFMDDALLAHGEAHLLAILDRCAGVNVPLHFHCPNGLHCRWVSPAVAEALFARRFEMIPLSYESSEATSRGVRAGDGKTNDRYFAQAVENLARAGYRRRDLQAYVLVGLPGQTFDQMRCSAAVAHDLGVRVRLCQFSPIPGTPLFEPACREYGLDPGEPLGHNNSVLPYLDRRLGADAHQAFKNHVLDLNRRLD